MARPISTPAEVGEILRARRRKRRLTQTDVAEALGLSQERLSRLESDASQLTLDRLIALARLLGLELVLRNRSEASSKNQEW